jgi:hypothetical protein
LFLSVIAALFLLPVTHEESVWLEPLKLVGIKWLLSVHDVRERRWERAY